MRVESAKPCVGGFGGWLHRLSDPLPVREVVEPRRKAVADITALADKMHLDPLASEKRDRVSKILGVSVKSLVSLRVGIGWDWDSREFSSWPTSDAEGKAIGITRRYDDGTKKTLAGTSNSGIFTPHRWWLMSGPVCIVEGGSDTAALITHGFSAIGRPSNVGGWQTLKSILSKIKRKLLVIGENDRKPDKVGTAPHCPCDCDGCSWCWPGRYGAVVTAEMLGCLWQCVPETYKDVRAWANAEGEGFRDLFRAWQKQHAPMEVAF